MSGVSLNLCRHPLVTISSGSKSYKYTICCMKKCVLLVWNLSSPLMWWPLIPLLGKNPHWTSDFCLICRNKNLPNVSSAVSSLWTPNLVFCPCSHCYSPSLNLFQCYSISWSGGLRWDELAEYRDIKLASVFLKLEIS